MSPPREIELKLEVPAVWPSVNSRRAGCGVCLRIAPGQKERLPRSSALERVEDARRGAGFESIVGLLRQQAGEDRIPGMA
jgi:hypothetical protein